MANVHLFVSRSVNLLNSTVRYEAIGSFRQYASIPKFYLKPLVKEEEQEAIKGTEQERILSHSLIRPATTSDTSSEFHDNIVRKFTNFVMRKGKKVLARQLVEKTFENIKMKQLQRYNSTSPDKTENIELDPKVILHRAIENSTPVLELMGYFKGGIRYQVPVPVSERRASFLAMNWLIKAGQEKDGSLFFPEKLATELLNASNNQGKVVKKKQELHRQCEANRAYAHFRWQ